MKKLIITYLFLFFTIYLAESQCYPDRHSTTWYDGWISCETSINPNSTYGSTHWIMYDFGYEYELKETKFWNANEPDNLDYGINEFYLDYSLDGIEWINFGTFNLSQGDGRSIYEGEEGPNFNEITARYVLITPISNFGGDCYGFSELRININDPLTVIDEEDGFNAVVYPNPFTSDVTLRIATLDEESPVTFALYDILGRQILASSLDFTPDNDTYELELSGDNLSEGIYILKIEQADKAKSFKLIKD